MARRGKMGCGCWGEKVEGEKGRESRVWWWPVVVVEVRG